jgi:hypothetical protein
MTTSTITHRPHHRPASFIAAAVAAVAIAAGSVAFSVSHRADAPGPPPPTSVGHDTSSAHQFHPTTSGGRVMLGE